MSSGIGRYAIGSFGEGGGSGPSGAGPVEGLAANGCDSQQVAGPGGGARGGTVSASAAGGRGGALSRRSSRDQSPSRASSEGQDAPTHGGGGGGGTGGASGTGATGPGQDWRRLVGSIRRKVRRKTGQSSASISALHETTNRNQDDFLKATMRIFLVVSPPMGRVQVSYPFDFYSRREFSMESSFRVVLL